MFCFFNLFLEVSLIKKDKKIIIQMGNIFGIQRSAGEVRKNVTSVLKSFFLGGSKEKKNQMSYV